MAEMLRAEVLVQKMVSGETNSSRSTNSRRFNSNSSLMVSIISPDPEAAEAKVSQRMIRGMVESAAWIDHAGLHKNLQIGANALKDRIPHFRLGIVNSDRPALDGKTLGDTVTHGPGADDSHLVHDFSLRSG